MPDSNTNKTARTVIADFLEIMNQEIKVVDEYKQDAFHDMMSSNPQIKEAAMQKFLDYCNRMDGLFLAVHAISHAYESTERTADILGCYTSGGNYNSGGATPYKRVA